MRLLALLACLTLSLPASAQLLASQDTTFTRADTLRGSITPQRAWWDVTFYDLHVRISPADSSIRGSTGIRVRTA